VTRTAWILGAAIRRSLPLCPRHRRLNTMNSRKTVGKKKFGSSSPRWSSLRRRHKRLQPQRQQHNKRGATRKEPALRLLPVPRRQLQLKLKRVKNGQRLKPKPKKSRQHAKQQSKQLTRALRFGDMLMMMMTH
jgi:hypothetical protein